MNRFFSIIYSKSIIVICVNQESGLLIGYSSSSGNKLNSCVKIAVMENIHPTFDKLLGRSDRERFLSQRAKTIWLTGLSGSGKSTIAAGLERRLFEAGYLASVLDGDNTRAGLNQDLGFSLADRQENIRRLLVGVYR